MTVGTTLVFWSLHIDGVFFLGECVPGLLRPGGGGPRTSAHTPIVRRSQDVPHALLRASGSAGDHTRRQWPFGIVPCLYVLDGSNRLCGVLLYRQSTASSRYLIFRTSEPDRPKVLSFSRTMPAAVISTELVHTTVPPTVSSPPHEFETKREEMTIAIQGGDPTITEGSVSGCLSPTKSQPAPEKSSIFCPSNIEEVPVVNDPRQWSQRRKVSNKVT